MSNGLELWTDISVNQNCKPGSSTVLPIDFARMKLAGATGVCIRKSSGYYRDVAAEMNWKAAGEAGLKRTMYSPWYVGYDYGRQFKAMTTWADDRPVDPDCLDRPFWLDTEHKYTGDVLPTPSQKQIAINQFIKFLFSLKGYYVKSSEVYTAKFVFRDYYSDKPGWEKDWGLVVANYGVATPALPPGWTDWLGWQFSADGNHRGEEFGVHSRDIDLSWQKPRPTDQPPDIPPTVPEVSLTFRRGAVKLVIVER